MAPGEEAVESAEQVAVAPPVESAEEMPAAADDAKPKPKKTKTAKALSKKPKTTLAHPPYLEMICDAITSLKERTGSSLYAIAKFTEDKHKAHLPPNFKKMLSSQLKKFVTAGKLVKVKHSFKLPARSAPAKPAGVKKVSPTGKPKAKATASKVKTPVKPKKSAAKPKTGLKRKMPAKPSAAVKPKSAPKPKSVAKPKTVAKPKAVASKAKPKSGRPTKVAKTSTKATAVSKKPAKKPAATKPKSIKSVKSSAKKGPARKPRK